MREEKKKTDYIAVFKREARNYLYYESRVRALKDRITLLDMRMQGVYSPVLDKIGQTPTRHELDRELVIQQKDGLNQLRKYYQDKLDWIGAVIDSIPSPAYRSLVWLTYVEREGLKGIADDFDVSRTHIYRMRNRFLEAALTDERMAQLQEIEAEHARNSPEDERLSGLKENEQDGVQG